MRGVDPIVARSLQKNVKGVKCTVRRGPKGNSLFCTKPIRKNSVIAYYKFLVHKWDKLKGYKHNMYVMTVYNHGRESKTFIGDVFPGSLEKPKRGIPFIAHFSNEPSGRQKENCYLDIRTKANYRNRSRVKEGDTMVYCLRALRNIEKNEEIVWCYSSSYQRGYKANCDD